MQSIKEYTIGMKMFYPFVAPIYKAVFGDKGFYYPPLDDVAGLNVSTYMESAIIDFGIIEPYIYMIYLLLILRVGQISLGKGVYGFLCYVSGINLSLWMVFLNALAIGSFMIAYLFFLLMAWKKHIKLMGK